jgi:hypothetical protein
MELIIYLPSHLKLTICKGRSPSYGRGSLGYPKKNIILELVGMYLYSATPNKKY